MARSADRLEHLGRQDLADADLLACGVLAGGVDEPRGMQHGQPELQQLGVGIGDERLHQLLVGQQTALGEAAFRSPGHHVERPLGHADGPHRVVDATAGQPGLQDLEAVPGLAQHRRRGHAHVVVVDERMPGLVWQRSDEVMGGLDVQPRRAGRDEECRRATVNRDVRVGDGDDDEERRHRRVGRKVLAAVDHPVVTVEYSPGGEHPGIRPALRLGHREAGEDLTGQQRPRGIDPSAPACRTARGSRHCRCRVPGCRRRSAPNCCGRESR